jgi:hypothetical protein
MSNQITTGAPKIEVTALIGNEISVLGICEMLSQINVSMRLKNISRVH